MGQIIFLAYVGLLSACLIALIERSIRFHCGKLTIRQRVFTCLPTILLLFSAIFYLWDILSSKTQEGFITNATLVIGLLSIMILPFAVATPFKKCWACMPSCWGLYILWIFIVFYPLMLVCGVSFRD